MKRHLHGILVAFFLLFSAGLFAQGKTGKISAKTTGKNGNPSLVVFKKNAGLKLGQGAGLLKEQLKAGSDDVFRKTRTERDQIGYIHEKYQQYHKGIKVEFATYAIHAKGNEVVSISGEFYEIDQPDLNPKLSRQAGLEKAMAYTGAKSFLWEDVAASKELGYEKPKGELVLLPNFDDFDKREDANKMYLAYKYEVFTINPLGGADIYIDAQTGALLFYNARVKHVDNFGHDGRDHRDHITTVEREEIVNALAPVMVSGTAATRYSGTQTIETTLSGSNYTLNDASRKVYTRNANNLAPSGSSLPYITDYTEFTDNDNNWTAAEYDNANKDNAALDAHWGAMMTYDYFNSVHSRDSYDGNGSQLRSYVHVDNNYDNAFWYLNVMSYGDGSSNGNEGNGSFDALTSIDVAAHEIGHGVCEYTANLAYQRESGAMNEGFSDIWGAAVEHFAKGNGSDTNPDSSVWLIGDEIDRRTGSAALRSMSDPTSLGQPDTYGGTYWINPQCGTPTQSNDYCGVHTNSGVLNYWFYLLVVGGSGTNDIGNSFNVSSIGMAKAANIAYRLESVYLSANSTYADARAQGIQAATDLYGADSPEVISTTNAWHAVGIGGAYSIPSCSSTVNSFPYNEGFESGLGAWLQGSSDDMDWTRDSSGTPSSGTGPSAAVEGSYYMYTEASSPNYPSKTAILEGPCFDLSGVSNATITFQYHMYGASMGTLKLEAREDGSSTWTTIWSKTGDQGNSWQQAEISLAAYTNVQLRFHNTTGSSYTGDATIDDIAVTAGAGADTEAPTAPTNLTASGTTQTTTNLSWTASTDNVGVTGYDIYQGATLLGTVTGTSEPITGLTAGTTYTFSVRAKDAAGNVSAASNTVTVTTLSSGGGCTGGITSYPYNEGFENTLGAWTQSSADDLDWTVDASGTPSSNTGPSSATEGTYYIYVEASGDGTGYPNKQAILNSPCFDLSAETQASFSFKYHMYGASDMGTIALEASTDNGANWTSIWSESGNKGDSWQTANIDLASYTGGTVQLRFNRITGSTWQADIALDAIALSTSGGGSGCSNVSLSITFDNYPEETSWEIKNSSGTVVASGGTYGSEPDGSTLNIAVGCLPAGCYDLIFYDTYGDGMCCNYGNGSYTLTNTDSGSTLATGGSFTSSQTTNFCLTSPTAVPQTFVTQQESTEGNLSTRLYPNPVNGDILRIRTTMENVIYSISNVMGQQVAKGHLKDNEIQVGNLVSGVYTIRLTNERLTIIKKFIKE